MLTTFLRNILTGGSVNTSPATGDDAAIITWYEANRDHLVFDSATEKFMVRP
ncbi:MAG: hypothetical protein ABIP97_13535 [Chthoniobacterales bacterium]